MKVIFALAMVGFALGCSSTSSSSSVSAIAVTPSPCAVGHTSSIQMTAVATLPDGTKEDVTSTADWSSGNTQTLTVNPTGVVVGVNLGVTSVTAAFEGATGNVNCTVVP